MFSPKRAKRLKRFSSSKLRCCYRESKDDKQTCKVFLAVFDLKTQKVELNTLLNPQFVELRGPFPESRYANIFCCMSELSDISKHQGTVLSATENLLIIQLYEFNRKTDELHSCFVIHLGQLKKGCPEARPSWKHLFMHPTRNVLIQLPHMYKVDFPISITMCLDLPSDEKCSLLCNQSLTQTQVRPLSSVTYVVTDAQGLAVQVKELRVKPAYLRPLV